MSPAPHITAEIAELTFQLLADCQEKEERLAAQLRIHVSEFRCLRAFRGDTVLPVKTLVERTGLSGSRMTRIIGSLEKRGFLQRVIDPSDRRSISAHLTKRGVALTEQLERRFLETHEEILRTIPKELHEPLALGLKNMLASLQVWLSTSK